MDDWAKYAYTAILCLNHMAYAMSMTAISPVLTELVDILQTSPQYMTMFTTFTSIGFLIGSFFCFLLKYLNRQLVWIAFLVLMSIALTLVPHSSGLAALYACATGLGMGAGVLNTVMPVWIIEMWKERSPAVLQIPGLTFGIGTIFSPLIIRPFLRERYTVSNDTGSDEPEKWIYNNDYEEWRRSLLFIPFIILGIIQLLFPITMTVMFVFKRYYHTEEYSEPNQNEDGKQEAVDSVKKLFDRQTTHRTLILVIFCIMLSFFNIFECMYYTFATTYFQYSPLQLSGPKAAEVITGFTLPYTVFRGISILIALKVLPKHMLSCHYVLTVVGLVLLVAARNSLTLLWVANAIVGIGCSALMQTIFAFIGQHIQLTDQIGTILIVVMGTLNIAPPYLLGLFIKDYSIVFVLVEFITIAVCIVLFITLMLFIWKYERVERNTREVVMQKQN